MLTRNFKFYEKMKKIASLLIFGLLFASCAPDDKPSEESIISSSTSIGFVLDGQTQYAKFSGNPTTVARVTWTKNWDEASKSYDFNINSFVGIKASSAKDNQNAGAVSIDIKTTDESLIVGKTYDIDLEEGNLFDVSFPLVYNPNLCYSSTDLYYTSNSVGTVKIVSFDGTTLNGEFTISNLSNSNFDYPIKQCNGVDIPVRLFNITDGVFVATIGK